MLPFHDWTFCGNGSESITARQNVALAHEICWIDSSGTGRTRQEVPFQLSAIVVSPNLAAFEIPTATQSPEPAHEIVSSWSSFVSRTGVQAWPSQRLACPPTSMQFVGLVHQIPSLSWILVSGSTFQLVPFHATAVVPSATQNEKLEHEMWPITSKPGTPLMRTLCQLLPFQVSDSLAPTATHRPGLGHDTAVTTAGGAGSSRQLVPFQATAMPCCSPFFAKLPTARQFAALPQLTPVSSKLVTPAGLLIWTLRQDLPFQASAPLRPPTVTHRLPAAQATLAALAAGGCSGRQDEPFHLSITACDPFPGPPVAMQLVRETHPSCSVWALVAGILTNRHDLPFQAAETGPGPTVRQKREPEHQTEVRNGES